MKIKCVFLNAFLFVIQTKDEEKTDVAFQTTATQSGSKICTNECLNRLCVCVCVSVSNIDKSRVKRLLMAEDNR